MSDETKVRVSGGLDSIHVRHGGSASDFTGCVLAIALVTAAGLLGTAIKQAAETLRPDCPVVSTPATPEPGRGE